MSEYYRDTLAQLRQEAAEKELKDRFDNVEFLRDEISRCEQDASDAVARGDREGAVCFMQSAAERNRDLMTALAQLPPSDPHIQERAAFISQYSPEDLQRPHWSGAVDANGRPLTTGEVMFGYGHNRALQMGLPDGSKPYFDALDVVGPVEKNGLPSPDEVAKMCGISGREYNRQVKKIYGG